MTGAIPTNKLAGIHDKAKADNYLLASDNENGFTLEPKKYFAQVEKLENGTDVIKFFERGAVRDKGTYMGTLQMDIENNKTIALNIGGDAGKFDIKFGYDKDVKELPFDTVKITATAGKDNVKVDMGKLRKNVKTTMPKGVKLQVIDGTSDNKTAQGGSFKLKNPDGSIQVDAYSHHENGRPDSYDLSAGGEITVNKDGGQTNLVAKGQKVNTHLANHAWLSSSVAAKDNAKQIVTGNPKIKHLETTDEDGTHELKNNFEMEGGTITSEPHPGNASTWDKISQAELEELQKSKIPDFKNGEAEKLEPGKYQIEMDADEKGNPIVRLYEKSLGKDPFIRDLALNKDGSLKLDLQNGTDDVNKFKIKMLIKEGAENIKGGFKLTGIHLQGSKNSDEIDFTVTGADTLIKDGFKTGEGQKHISLEGGIPLVFKDRGGSSNEITLDNQVGAMKIETSDATQGPDADGDVLTLKSQGNIDYRDLGGKTKLNAISGKGNVNATFAGNAEVDSTVNAPNGHASQAVFGLQRNIAYMQTNDKDGKHKLHNKINEAYEGLVKITSTPNPGNASTID